MGAAECVQIGPCQLWLGDCRAVLPLLSGVDAVVSDPPYGIAWTGPRMRRETVIGDDEPFDPSPLLDLNVPAILWGANNFASRLPDSQNWLVWLKRAVDKGCRSKDHGDCELAWSRGCFNGGSKVKRFIWDGNIRETDHEMERLHPAQKPVKVMEWCLSFLPDECLVLDPFMGSGSTGVAAVRRGMRFIGCEIDPGHFSTACRRIQAAWDAERSSLFPAFGAAAE